MSVGTKVGLDDYFGAGGTREGLERCVVDRLPNAESGSRGQGSSEDFAYMGSTPEPWDEPVPLADPPRPPFPTDTLPTRLRSFVDALALATQTPAALSAMLCVAVLAASAANRVAVRIRAGWVEPINIFVLVALPPGNRKTQVFKEAVAPLEEHEAREAKRLAPEIAQAATRRKIGEQVLAKAQQAAASAEPGEWSELTVKAEEQARLVAEMKIPEPPRLIVDDCSPEKLANLLTHHDGRIAAMSAEGGLFDMIAGRYGASGVPNLDVYLKGHAGDTLRVDRVGRPSEFVANPALTVALAVQPDVVRGLVDKPGFRGRGLLARFHYGMPDSLVGRRAIAPPPVPDPVREAYAAVVRGVLALRPLREDDGSPKPQELRLGDDAAAAFLAFEEELEPRLSPAGDLAHVADWAAKLAGAVARWAGILHVAERAEVGDEAPWDAPIEAHTMEAAIRIAREFLAPHALAAFGEMGADPTLEDAHHVLRWLEGHPTDTEGNPMDAISKRDLYQRLRLRFAHPGDLDPALRILTEHGYLRECPQPEQKGPGRKPSPRFEINPRWRSQNARNAQKPSERTDSEVIVHSVNGRDAPAEGGPSAANGGCRASRTTSSPDASPAVEVTARRIVALDPDELMAYRTELSAASDDDPHLSHDRAALAHAERLMIGQWPEGVAP